MGSDMASKARAADGRFKKGGRGGGNRTGGSGSGSGRRRRRADIVSATDTVGLGGTVYGLFLAPYDNGDGPIKEAQAGNYTQAVKEASPTSWIGSKAPSAGMATGKKATVIGSLVVLVGGRVLARFWRAPVVKLDARHRIRLWGAGSR